jgi:hypothetical protein
VRAVRIAAAALLFSACIPYPGELPPDDSGRSVITDGPFAPLDAGAYQLDSLHFTLRAYGGEKARAMADTAEQAYNRVMQDTGLYSFKPKGLYQIVLYAGEEEYRRKTGQPSWSGGVAVGNAIYTYEGPMMERILSHEMTHLIVYEYMGFTKLEHRWVNEGLAVYEENKAVKADALGHSDIFSAVRGSLRQQPMTMDQMIHLTPASEKDYSVSLWYAQAESMVRFMIERGGRMGFAQFLACLRDGKGFDQAVSESFGGAWRTLADMEAAWLRGQQ